MPAFQRYAIYYTPPPGPLARFGAGWLGRDIDTGRTTDNEPDIPDLPAPREALTETPRRYGFHATMKPPFCLAPHQREAELRATLAAFCAARPAPVLTGLALTRMGRFLALTPSGEARDVAALAAETVRAFDGFRAAPSDAEIARHQRADLSTAQAQRLHRWGSPHVMADFRWHMTLTGKRPRAETERTRAALAPVLAPLLGQPLKIDALSLVGEDAGGDFHLIQRIPLTG